MALTQADIMQLEAGLELNIRTDDAILVHLALNAGDTDAAWPWPSLWSERLRRRLDLPALPGTTYPTYCETYTHCWSEDVNACLNAAANCGVEFATDPGDAVDACRQIIVAAFVRLNLP